MKTIIYLPYLTPEQYKTLEENGTLTSLTYDTSEYIGPCKVVIQDHYYQIDPVNECSGSFSHLSACDGGCKTFYL